MLMNRIIELEEKRRKENMQDMPTDYFRRGSSVYASFELRNPIRIAKNWKLESNY